MPVRTKAFAPRRIAVPIDDDDAVTRIAAPRSLGRRRSLDSSLDALQYDAEAEAELVDDDDFTQYRPAQSWSPPPPSARQALSVPPPPRSTVRPAPRAIEPPRPRPSAPAPAYAPPAPSLDASRLTIKTPRVPIPLRARLAERVRQRANLLVGVAVLVAGGALGAGATAIVRAREARVVADSPARVPPLATATMTPRAPASPAAAPPAPTTCAVPEGALTASTPAPTHDEPVHHHRPKRPSSADPVAATEPRHADAPDHAAPPPATDAGVPVDDIAAAADALEKAKLETTLP